MATTHLHACTSKSDELSLSSHKRKAFVAFSQTLKARFRAWRQRVAGRQQLAELNCHALRDIGVTHLQARDKWQKPLWRP